MREASAAQVGDNAEINAIKQILGLQHGKNYTDAKALRCACHACGHADPESR